MGQDFTELAVIKVDTEGIIKDPDNPNRYRLAFKLSAVPDKMWVQTFETVYKPGKYSPSDRKAHIEGDCVVLLIAENEDLKHHAYVVKRAVQDTNAAYRERLQEMERGRQESARAREAEEQRLEALREKASKLEF